MGHIINATVFRLGKVKKTINTWVRKDPKYQSFLIKDIYIFQFIKFFFMAYNIPVFSLTHIRNKNTGNDDILVNPWIKNGFAFSSCKIIRNKYLGIFCAFLDSLLEEIRTIYLRSLKANTYLKYKKYKKRKPLHIHDIFYKSKLIIRKKYKNKKYKKRFYFVRLNIKYNKKHLKIKKGKIKKLMLKKIKKSKPLKLKKFTLKNNKKKAKGIYWSNMKSMEYKRRFKRTYPFIFNYKKYLEARNYKIKNKIKRLTPLSLNLLKKQSLYKKYTKPNKHKKSFKLLKILLIIFKQKIKTWKQQFFIIILLKKILLPLIKIQLKKKPLFKMFQIMNLLTIKEFTYKHLNIYYFKKIFRYRYLIFQNATSILYSGIRALDKTKNIKISFSSTHIRKISASQICNYITIKLGQYFKLYEVLQPTIQTLKRTKAIKGFRILIVGRLTRKERAAHIIRKKGSIPLSTKKKYIDFAADHKVMRFGMVGIKVWLYTKHTTPYFYTFKFNLIQNNSNHGIHHLLDNI